MSFIVNMSKTAHQVFIEYLRKNDLSMTPQRSVIVETFLETEGHYSAEQLGRLVKKKFSDVGQATVYRTLKLLVDSGLADAFDLGDGVMLYEHQYGHAHHDHFVCVNCGRKIEIVDECIESWQEELARRHGFELTRHRMLLFGTCAECNESHR